MSTPTHEIQILEGVLLVVVVDVGHWVLKDEILLRLLNVIREHVEMRILNLQRYFAYAFVVVLQGAGPVHLVGSGVGDVIPSSYVNAD